MVRRVRLHGEVEVDESFLGGPEPGVPGRGALGKVLFAGAVELDERGFGRARLGVIPNASATSLAAFLDANVEPASRVITTDGWSTRPTRLPPGTATPTTAPRSRRLACRPTRCCPLPTGCSRWSSVG